MPPRPGIHSPSSSPSIETHSNENYNQTGQRRFYDTESDHVEYVSRREYRETYGSDHSNPAVNDYDNIEFREFFFGFFHSCFPPVMPCWFVLYSNGSYSTIAHHDTDSDHDAYAPRPEPSQESLPAQSRFAYTTESSTFMDYPSPPSLREAYAAWSSDRQIPLSKEEIEDVFLDLTQKFGFQRESMRNMVCCIFLCVVALGVREAPYSALPIFSSPPFSRCLVQAITNRLHFLLVRLLDAVTG